MNPPALIVCLCPRCGGENSAPPGALTMCQTCAVAIRQTGPLWSDHVSDLELPTQALKALRAERERLLGAKVRMH